MDGSVGNSFKRTILETMEYRKKYNIRRHDMVNIMMQIREGTLHNQVDEKINEKEGFATAEESVGKATVNHIWDDNEIVGQWLIFFVAGYDTSATMLAFAA